MKPLSIVLLGTAFVLLTMGANPAHIPGSFPLLYGDSIYIVTQVDTTATGLRYLQAGNGWDCAGNSKLAEGLYAAPSTGRVNLETGTVPPKTPDALWRLVPPAANTEGIGLYEGGYPVVFQNLATGHYLQVCGSGRQDAEIAVSLAEEISPAAQWDFEFRGR